MIVLSILATLFFLIETCLFSILSIFFAILDRSGKGYLWLARVWSRFSMLLFGIRIHVSGTENIEPGAHYVYVANHSSYLDIPIILAAVPDNIRLMFRSSLTRVPIWGWSMLLSPFILIDRSNAKKAQASLDKAVQTIRGGASILLFPEGTRTPTGIMQDFKRGAFHLAYDSGAPIIPVAIIGAFSILPRHKALPHWGKRAEVRIGKPIYFERDELRARAEEMRLMKEAEKAVRDLMG